MAEKTSMSGWDILKNVFFVLIMIQILPDVFSGLKKMAVDAAKPKTQVGLVEVRGVILDSKRTVKHIQKLRNDDNIKAVMVKIDTPGGLPGASQNIFQELLKCKAKKPIVVFIENLCASGGYYIAIAGNQIISTPSAVVGSVGNVLQFPELKKLANLWNVDVTIVKSGDYKTIGNPFEQTTDEQRAYLQQYSDDVYRQFTSDVAKYRALSLDDVKTWANGRIFTGSQALELNMIDQIGSLTDAEFELKKLAEISNEIKYIALPTPGIIQKLMSAQDDDTDTTEAETRVSNFCTSVIQKVITSLQTNGITHL